MKAKLSSYFSMKLLKFQGGFGKGAKLSDYIREETAKIEYTHVNQDSKGNFLVWLQSYGLTDWAFVFPTEQAKDKFISDKRQVERYIGGGQ